MTRLPKSARLILTGIIGSIAIGLLALIGSYIYITPRLPPIEALRDIRLQVPLRVYSKDHKLIAEFGKMKRTPLRYDQIPQKMIQAILAAEDDRFFVHPGVDYHGIIRAAINLALTGKKSQGGSTITMQVARNFFLSREKTYLRKLSEIFLSFKIEHELTKEEILELYLNKIYLGNRAYGIAAAAQIYYGKTIDELSIAEMATIAGLPKAPSALNPIVNPERAMDRRNYILSRMNQLGFIDNATLEQARNEPDHAEPHGLAIEVRAPYVAEMVRDHMVSLLGEEAYTGGYSVITTIEPDKQRAANAALHKALFDYDRRHGYRGIIKHVDLPGLAAMKDWHDVFNDISTPAGLQPAIVLSVADKEAALVLADDRLITLPWDGLSWARRYINDNALGPKPTTAGAILHTGDVVYVRSSGSDWALGQIPQVEGALVSLHPENGDIMALTGGLDFYYSKFNRATQAARQPGSSFKPFIYSAALNKGFTAATIVNDAPVVFDDPGLESAWRPENYSGKFFGPTRLRVGLIHSRNLISIRLLRSIGIDYTLDYVSRFGIPTADLPRDLSLALGSGALTPIQMAGGYAVFANGGYLITPHVIDHIEDIDGVRLPQAALPVVCPECDLPDDSDTGSAVSDVAPTTTAEAKVEAEEQTAADSNDETPKQPDFIPARRVVPAENVYLMTSMMRDVIQHGTGRRARRLGRTDIAGKTGTTNDQRDAWFAGFNPDVVTISWVGFDKVRSLGNYETGSRAALPMWNAYMHAALHGLPIRTLKRPPGMVSVRIDPETGLLADADLKGAIFETFRSEFVPRRGASSGVTGNTRTGESSPPPANANISEQLF
jgi:penicillin-binding protein 1A